MLKKRSRGTSKQSLMADSGSISSPTNKYTKPNLSFFNSPLLFTGISTKGLSETDALKSPTSTLDSMLFSGLANPFWIDKTNATKSPQDTSLENKHPWMKKLDSRGIVDALNDDVLDQKFSKPDSRMVLFGSQLKIQIPPLVPFAPSSTPRSPSDFGIKTRNSQLELLSASPNPSPSTMRKLPFGSVTADVEGSPRVFVGCLSASEMESSEDYTCVITHGPNPRTTHIFDDCIVDDCCGVVGFSSLKKGDWFLSDTEEQLRMSYPSNDFLSFCYTCKKNLGQGNDIYIYRGEKAFCSRECRHQEIMFEEGMEKTDFDDLDKS